MPESVIPTLDELLTEEATRPERELLLVSGWVVEASPGCTCSQDFGAHESSCGLEPICPASEWMLTFAGLKPTDIRAETTRARATAVALEARLAILEDAATDQTGMDDLLGAVAGELMQRWRDGTGCYVTIEADPRSVVQAVLNAALTLAAAALDGEPEGGSGLECTCAMTEISLIYCAVHGYDENRPEVPDQSGRADEKEGRDATNNRTHLDRADPGRPREAANRPDRQGFPAGAGVPDHPGPDPQRRLPDVDPEPVVGGAAPSQPGPHAGPVLDGEPE